MLYFDYLSKKRNYLGKLLIKNQKMKADSESIN
jgi:hypothetical protein